MIAQTISGHFLWNLSPASVFVSNIISPSYLLAADVLLIHIFIFIEKNKKLQLMGEFASRLPLLLLFYL